MRERAVETFRTFLTITGLLLLVVFGTRAASQAQNKQLAGAAHNSITQFLQHTGLAGLSFDSYHLASLSKVDTPTQTSSTAQTVPQSAPTSSAVAAETPQAAQATGTDDKTQNKPDKTSSQEPAPTTTAPVSNAPTKPHAKVVNRTEVEASTASTQTKN